MDPTKAQLQQSLATWYAADDAAAAGQSYSIDGQELTRADGHMIKAKITQLRRQLIDIEVAAAGGTQGIRKAIFS